MCLDSISLPAAFFLYVRLLNSILYLYIAALLDNSVIATFHVNCRLIIAFYYLFFCDTLLCDKKNDVAWSVCLVVSDNAIPSHMLWPVHSSMKASYAIYILDISITSFPNSFWPLLFSQRVITLQLLCTVYFYLLHETVYCINVFLWICYYYV